MSTLTFDTHSFVKRLIAAGMPEEQAEVLAQEQTRVIDEKLATKHDLRELEFRLKPWLGGQIAIAMSILVAVAAVLVKVL